MCQEGGETRAGGDGEGEDAGRDSLPEVKGSVLKTTFGVWRPLVVQRQNHWSPSGSADGIQKEIYLKEEKVEYFNNFIAREGIHDTTRIVLLINTDTLSALLKAYNRYGFLSFPIIFYFTSENNIKSSQHKMKTLCIFYGDTFILCQNA